MEIIIGRDIVMISFFTGITPILFSFVLFSRICSDICRHRRSNLGLGGDYLVPAVLLTIV